MAVGMSQEFSGGKLHMAEETFETLLTSNLQWVRKLVRTRLRMSDQVDDVAQQTLLRAFACRHQLRDRSKIKNWLWSIALNEVRMFLRGSRPAVSLDEFANPQFAD